ncbi:hypothetical protein NA56DRAFT_691054 [Hyaloscypha hepaticicola]|uniref:Uncharacterized protein n=1 Tax=Hyaloscypha hepaticicola TaxID=2082293 RepID=A0A2J6PXE8_9HELO|nr:hypothetical protein NA56DRAFT_691054 [Hyaloscypha hepaticicola]
MKHQKGRCKCGGERAAEAVPATFRDWMTTIRPRTNTLWVAEDLTNEDQLASHINEFLAYLGTPEFPQSYHTLWKNHIHTARYLQRATFNFLPEDDFFTFSTQRSFQEWARDRLPLHRIEYSTLDEHGLHCKTVRNYGERVLRLVAPKDYIRFLEERKRQFGTGNSPSLLASFTADHDASEISVMQISLSVMRN